MGVKSLAELAIMSEVEPLNRPVSSFYTAKQPGLSRRFGRTTSLGLL